MKKVMLFVLATCMIATLGIATAQAGWYNAMVTGTGAVGNQSTYICLTEQSATPAFTNRWFILNAAQAKSHLATALTAISSGLPVQVYFTQTGVPPAYATVYNMYLNNGFTN
ncbi:MAG: hypothetical protein PHX53_07500 [Syntrophales bacterium]|nr:hypothetical protein [Syntrophales bacterium]